MRMLCNCWVEYCLYINEPIIMAIALVWIKNSIYLSTHHVLCNIIWRRSFFLFAALWQLLDNAWKIYLECYTFKILTTTLQKSEVMQPSEIVPFICLSIISKKFLIKIQAEAQWINDTDQGPKSSNGSHYICGMMLNNG